MNRLTYLFSVLASCSAPLISKLEAPLIRKYGNRSLKRKPIFIIGAPRTGSTFLYQVLTHLYDTIYIDNLSAFFYRNLYFGFWLSNLLFRNRSHGVFKSQFGRVRGLHGPCECGSFWYRWLPSDRHFIDHAEVEDSVCDAIRRELGALVNRYNKPLIIKNLNAGQRIRLLTRCFPQAAYLFITRDPLQTSMSIISAKRSLGLPDNKYWSIMPANFQALESMQAHEQIVKQVYFTERQIMEDSKLIPADLFHVLDYDRLSLDAIQLAALRLKLRPRDNVYAPNVFPKVSFHSNVDLKDKELFLSHIHALDWSFKRSIISI